MLSNQRILLRAPEPEDLPQFYEWENDTALWAFGDNLTPYSALQLKRFIEESIHDLFSERQLRLVIEWNEEKIPVGCLDLFNYNPLHRHAEVGILIANAAFRNRGIASEALTILTDYSATILNIKNLFAQVPAVNEASIRLFESCTFTVCGIKKSCLFNNGQWYDVITFQKQLFP